MRKFWSFWLSELALLSLFMGNGFAQTNVKSSDYLFPINPGQINQLYGTMGELRSSHFHGGLDIRTNNESGWPIRATNDGYISRAKMSSFGYGNAIYITHYDGNISLYGHLDRMNGDIFDYITKRQIECKNHGLDEYFPANKFMVKRGDTIGFSGNTGSSNGAHLHFEIRSNNSFINPLKFGFTEIVDNIPPRLYKIALRTLDIDSRVNGKFGRYEFSLIKRSDNKYVIANPINSYGRIGVELLAIDRINHSPGKCGVNELVMKVNDQQIFSQVINNIDIEKSRCIQSVINYSTYSKTGKSYYKLYVDKGNPFDFYNTIDSGIVTIDSINRKIEITVKDAYENESIASFNLVFSDNNTSLHSVSRKQKEYLYSERFENLLKISAQPCSDTEKINVFSNGLLVNIPPSYTNHNQKIFLIDLKKLIPDSIKLCGNKLEYQIKAVVPSNSNFKYFSDYVDIEFPKYALYDTLFLDVNKTDNQTFKIGHPTIPLRYPINVSLKFDSNKPKSFWNVYRKNASQLIYLNGKWRNERIRFDTNQFGEFVFLADSIPPTISRIKLNRQEARFRIADTLSDINWYKATINGEWLLMSYDYKSGICKTIKGSIQKPIKGDFKLIVTDNEGNETVYKQKII